MIPTRPYLIRAFYEWIVDNQLTPYILVDVEDPDVDVPQAFIEDGKIVLNICDTAANKLRMGNQVLTFDAKFSGEEQSIVAPVKNILAIYAKENGRGMVFSPEDEDWGDDDGGGDGGPGSGGPGSSGDGDDKPSSGGKKPPKLTVVK